MSTPEKLGDVGERLLKWAAEHADELDRRSAEYDRTEAERRERESADSVKYLERIRGLPLSQHPGVTQRPWPAYCLIHGPVGAGKTRRAVEHLLSVPRDNGIFVGFAEYLELARQVDLDRASDFERDRYSAARKRKYLVLDDLGARRVTPFAVDSALDLIKVREDITRFHTIVTSNFTLAELVQDWDEPIASRVGGLGPTELLEGPDWRLRAARRVAARKEGFLRFQPRGAGRRVGRRRNAGRIPRGSRARAAA
jgi:hypothetical protein